MFIAYPKDIRALGSAKPIEPPSPECPNASSERIRLFVEAEPDPALRVLTSGHGVQQRRLIDALRAVLEESAAAGDLALRVDPGDLAYVMVRIAESFIWREFITGEEPDLSKAGDIVRILLS